MDDQMKILTPKEAKGYLSRVGVTIGNWNELRYVEEDREKNKRWFNYRAPDRARECYIFSLFVSGWVSQGQGQWKVLQLDNSNQFAFHENALLSRFITDSCTIIDLNSESNSTFLFNSRFENKENLSDEIRFAALIHLMLLFKGHGYLISSADAGDHMGIHDGFIYFISTEDGLARGRALVQAFEKRKSDWPQWLIDTEIAWQENALAGC